MNKAQSGIDELGLLLEDKPFDLRAFFNKYILRYWWLYALGLLLGGAGAWLYLRYAIPQYQVKCTLLIKDPATSGEVASEQLLLQELGMSGANKNIQNEIPILKSRTLMEETVRRLGLDVTTTAIGRVRNSVQYHRSPVGVERLDSLSKAYRGKVLIQPLDNQRFHLANGDSSTVYAFGAPVNLKNKGSFIFHRNPDVKFLTPLQFSFRELADVAQGFAGKLNIKVVGEWSSVLELSMRDEVAERASDILNTLVDVYNEAAIEDKNRVGRNTLDFINERLVLLTDELETVEKGVEDYKRRNNIATASDESASRLLEEISGVGQQLSELEVQQSISRYLSEFLSANRGQYALIPANLTLDAGGLNEQINAYNEKVLERDRLLRTAGKENPLLRTLEQEILAIESNLLAAVADLQRSQAASASLMRERLGGFRGQASTIPRKERELLEIVRQARIKENLYLYLLEKREETALSLAVAVPNSRLIDNARPTSKPVEPQENLIRLAGLLLGLMLPAGFVAIKELLRDTVHSEEDIRSQTSIPLFGSIGFSKAGKQLVVTQGSRSAIAEMFRLLRTNLQFARSGKGCQTVLITSGISGEGKSFITLNLGMSLALSNYRTLIVGLDLRKPKLHRYLDMQGVSPGISQYLIGETNAADIVHATPLHPNLSFIPSGPIPPNPAELIQTERMQELMDILQQEFDYIILDSPPLGLVSDALLLNR
ncbi:MAG: polysaccharide biosynthesis tyrosine autokinase, partial [Phaeodactylibacter sp.]|nr:polysaccharide biosynthesis tyrosine autokinase [Phaeodactylibacter sp.]